MDTIPRVDTLDQLARYFNVPTPLLIMEAGDDDDLNELLIRAVALPRDVKEQLAAIIRSSVPASLAGPGAPPADGA